MSDSTSKDVATSASTQEERPPLSSIKDIGIRCDKNSRHRRTMEDTHTYQDKFLGCETTGYFGVYDGHGGKQAAEFVRDHLHVVFAEKCASIEDRQDAFKAAFLQTDEKIGEAEIKFSGTTVVSALIEVINGTKKIHVANAGDARAVLARGNKGLRLSFDHKANDPDEIARIQAAGGFVVMNRVNGILAVARALGDRSMKDYVTGEPFTSTTEVTDEDSHLILACDGVWDVIEDDEAVQIIQAAENCHKAATDLLRASLKAGSTDNISVMVIKL